MKTVVELGKLVAEPLARRTGTAAAAYLIAQGVPQDTAHAFMLAVGVVAGLGLDVLTSFFILPRRERQ